MAGKLTKFSGDPEEFRKMFGPGHADQMVRQAIQSCWMILPKDKLSLDSLEKEFRRLVDRAFANLKEDELLLGEGQE